MDPRAGQAKEDVEAADRLASTEARELVSRYAVQVDPRQWVADLTPERVMIDSAREALVPPECVDARRHLAFSAAQSAKRRNVLVLDL